MSVQPVSQPMGYPTFGGYPGYASMGYPGMGFPQTTMPMDYGVERMVIPQTHMEPYPVQVQSFTTVNDTQTYMEPRQIPIKVPRVIMEDVEVSYQVPAFETRTNTAQRPRTVMEEQTITVPEARYATEQVPVQVPQVITHQVAQQHSRVIEYQRPQMMPGRYLRTYAGPAQTVGTVQAPASYTMPTAQYAMPATTTMPMATMPATTMPFNYGMGQTLQMPYNNANQAQQS